VLDVQRNYLNNGDPAMKLPPGVLRYLVIGQALIPIFFNVTIPLFLGWLTFRNQPNVTIWVLDKGAVADFIGTCYLLPAITCLIATPIVRAQAARGLVASIPSQDVPRWVRFYRGSLFWRATKCGLTGLIVLSIPVCLTWSQVAGTTIPTTTFLTVKVIFASVLGIIVTPLIALVALCDKSCADGCR